MRQIAAATNMAKAYVESLDVGSACLSCVPTHLAVPSC